MDEIKLSLLKLFGSSEPLSYKDEFKLYLESDTEMISSILEKAVPVIDVSPQKIIEELTEKYDLDRHKIALILTTSTYVFSRLNDERISYKDIDNYLKYLQLDNKDDKFKFIYETVGKKYLQKIEEYNYEIDVIHSVLPSLKGLQWNTNLRAIKKRDGGTKNVPIAQLKIDTEQLNESPISDKSVIFQMTLGELTEFISNLENVKKDIEKASNLNS